MSVYPQVGLIGQQTLVAYLEGRPTINPADPSWPLQRRAIEFVIEDLQRRDERERREIRRMVRRGELSKVEATRLLSAP